MIIAGKKIINDRLPYLLRKKPVPKTEIKLTKFTSDTPNVTFVLVILRIYGKYYKIAFTPESCCVIPNTQPTKTALRYYSPQIAYEILSFYLLLSPAVFLSSRSILLIESSS